MSSPLPGMDLYLEQPAFRSSFHSRFMVAIADAIEAQLNPAYYVEVEVRTYLNDEDGGVLIGIPDAVVAKAPGEEEFAHPEETPVAVQTRPQRVAVPMPEMERERYLEIRQLETGDVITAIELLSPANKRPGPGRNAYEAKRRQILSTMTHLVELDLLRGGEAMPVVGDLNDTPYRILISVSDQRPAADLYGVRLQDPLPTIPIPLKPTDQPVRLNLQTVFDGVYGRGRYGSRIDYGQLPPPPPLEPEEQRWLEQHLRSQD
ncbi:hypothetical protein C7271_22765 [filamentous cyanobacterium CCP5]|nr:hypothetical protein C7271_22765 [filamentous cyanobacterium CCP5]